MASRIDRTGDACPLLLQPVCGLAGVLEQENTARSELKRFRSQAAEHHGKANGAHRGRKTKHVRRQEASPPQANHTQRPQKSRKKSTKLPADKPWILPLPVSKPPKLTGAGQLKPPEVKLVPLNPAADALVREAIGKVKQTRLTAPPIGERGPLTDQEIAQGGVSGIILSPNMALWGDQYVVMPPKPASITAGQKYGPTFETPQAATQYAHDGLAKNWFGASNGAAIVKAQDVKGHDVYSVYGVQLDDQFSIRKLPAKVADSNLKAMTPHPALTALVSRDGVVADYRNGQAQVGHTRPDSEESIASKAMRDVRRWLTGDKGTTPSGSAGGFDLNIVLNRVSRGLDRVENAVSNTMPHGSQFAWAAALQMQVGSKELQGKLRMALETAAAELGAKIGYEFGKGQWKPVTGGASAVLFGTGAYVAGKLLIPSDLQLRVDLEGRKSNVLLRNTDVDAGTVRFGLINNMGGALVPGGDLPRNIYDHGANNPITRNGALITLDAALKDQDYQHTSAIALLGLALYNGLSAEMNVEVSYARPKDGSPPGQQGNAAAPLVPGKTKVWLSFSFAAFSEGSTDGQASATDTGWSPLKDKVSVTVQVPINADEIDKSTLAALTSNDASLKSLAALTIATQNADRIPFETAFDAALIASGLRPNRRIEDLLLPGVIASINTEYSASRKLSLVSISPVIESKITAGMTDEGKRIKYLGLKVTGQLGFDAKTGPVRVSSAGRLSMQVNIPQPIDGEGRISAKELSQALADMIAKIKTAQTAGAAQPGGHANLLQTHPYTLQLAALRASLFNSPAETGHWSAEERRTVEEKWQQAMKLADALEH
jgi:hypothetical protein